MLNDNWIWRIGQPGIPDQEIGSLKDKYHESIIRLLKFRGVTDPEEAEAFLNPAYEALGSPYALKGMKEAVELLLKSARQGRNHVDGHVSENEHVSENGLVPEVGQKADVGGRIVVYGDYDVDGITSISILIRLFKAIGVPLDFYIPDRMEEGYGLNMDAIRQIAQDHDVMITVDCGITSALEIEEGRRLGLKVIVTDHHECPEILPVAEAVINPKRSDNEGACELMAGAGVAFQLAKAFHEAYVGEPLSGELLEDLLELAAVGTIADVAPLKEDNRIIAKLGLEALNQTRNKGLAALIRKSGLEEKRLNAGHVGFMIGPKINASGRIGNPSDSVTLLTSDSDDEVERIASELVLLNTERQMIERGILETCIAQVEEQNLQRNKIIVVHGEGFHSGVIGIVASRLVERFHRPTLVFSVEGETARASARSIETVNLYQLLSGCRQYYVKFGGHEMAAGLTIKSDELESFYKDLLLEAERTLVDDDLIPVLKVDGLLKMADVQLALLDQLDLMEPYGMGNPKPVFAVEDVPLQMVKRMGKNEEHLKWLVQDDVRMIDCVMFNGREPLMAIPPKARVRMAFTMERNHFRGIESLQLSLKDARRIDILDELMTRWAEIQKGINHVISVKNGLEAMSDGVSEGMPYVAPWVGMQLDDLGDSCLDMMEESGTVNFFLADSESVFNKFINMFYDRAYRQLEVAIGEVTKPAGSHLVLRPDIMRLKTLMDRHLEEIKVFHLDNQVAERVKSGAVGAIRLRISDFPSRDQLARLYKLVRDQGENTEEFSLEVLMKETMMGSVQLGIALELLAGMGMVNHIRTQEGFGLQLIPFQGKISLEAHPLFVAVRNSIE